MCVYARNQWRLLWLFLCSRPTNCMTYDVLVSLTIDGVTLNAPCDWTKYFPFPVVYTYTWRSATETHGCKEEKKHPKFKINIAVYNRISVKYGRPGSDSRPPAPAVHRNRVSKTAISAAGASNDWGLLGKITSKLAVPLWVLNLQLAGIHELKISCLPAIMQC